MIDETHLLEYAYEKFQQNNYEEALEIFILLYMKGYQKEWILKNIYNCYVNGNEKEFQNAFKYCSKSGTDIFYEECILDFVPYKDGEYYIFDKEQETFCGVFSIWNLKDSVLDPAMQKMEFSSAVVVMDWNWDLQRHILVGAKNRNIYAVCHDIRRSISFCKIPELMDYMKHVKMFSDYQEFQYYFHENTGVYLPKIFYGLIEAQNELNQIVEKEHKYRLTPEGRNTENILLTIGIPTYDRGHLALRRVLNLLQSYYDSEIEFMVSKNGTRLHQEEYLKIAEIKDARLNYVDHGRELTPGLNWRSTVELSHGEYVLFISDEDDVMLESLEHYLAILRHHPELSFIEAATTMHGSFIQTNQYKKGREAFKAVFLGNNYLSGNIVRRELFLDLPFEEIEKYAEDNQYYMNYCHDWWFSLLVFQGDCRLDSMTLVVEGEEGLDEQLKAYGQKNIREDGLLPYSDYYNRLEQFKGYIGFVRFIESKGLDIVKIGIERAIGKTTYLLLMAYCDYKYKMENILDILDEFAKLCLWAVDEFPLEDVHKKELLQWSLSCAQNIIKETEIVSSHGGII